MVDDGRVPRNPDLTRITIHPSVAGRLATFLREFAAEHDQPWMVEVVHDPDKVLVAAPVDVLVASADSQIMDGAPRTWQLARETVEGMRPTRSILDLASEESAASAEERQSGLTSRSVS